MAGHDGDKARSFGIDLGRIERGCDRLETATITDETAVKRPRAGRTREKRQ
jgi:hypothetical protein